MFTLGLNYPMINIPVCIAAIVLAIMIMFQELIRILWHIIEAIEYYIKYNIDLFT